MFRLPAPRVPVTAASRLEKRILLGFIAALALMLVCAAYTYRAGADIARSAEMLAQSQALRQSARHLYGAVASAEAAQRAHLLSGGEEYRAAYERHASAVKALEARIENAAHDTPAALQSLAALKPLIASKLDELASQSATYAREGRDAAAAAARAAPGAALLESIFDATERIAAAEEEWLRERSARDVQSRFVTLVSLLLTIAVASGVLVLIFRSIRAEVAARAKSERALHEAHGFLDSIVENIPDMIFVKDAATLKFVRVNRAGEALLERSRHELVGRSDHDILPREIADAYTSKDREVIASGAPVDIDEEKIQTPTRGERILHTKKIPVRDEAGDVRYVLGIAEDVTERARAAAQIRALNEALTRRAAQIEAINRELETFAYSVSHDLRAPLRHISGYVQLLEQALASELQGEPRRYLEVIAQASRQMGELINDLLAFSRTTRANLQPAGVALRPIVDAVIAGLDMDTRDRAIEWRIGELPAVEADAAMLKVVYANLIGNAVKYSRGKKPATIEVGAAGEEAGRAVLYVRDDGTGFDMAHADRLFGIFQRLHHPDEFEGTGIGLATVQRIIARHGGRVWAHAAPGEGATFYFTLAKPAIAPSHETE